MWIELTKVNLTYLKAMVSAGQGGRGRTRPWKTKQSDAKPKSPKKKLRRLKAMSSSPSKHKEGPSRDVQVDGS